MRLLKKIDTLTVDYARTPVPEDKLRGPISLFLVWIVAMVNLLFIFFGITMSRGMPLEEAFLACLIGQTLSGLLLGITAIFAAKTRLASGQLLPHIFGKYGGMLISALIGFMGIMWFGFQLEVFSKSFTRITGLSGSALQIVIFVSGLIMISSGVIGFKAIDWLSRIATPFLFILIALPVIWYFYQGGSFTDLGEDSQFNQTITLGTGISMLMGGLAVPLIITADIMRYSASPKQAFWTTFLAQALGAVIIVGFALLLGRISAESEFVDIIAAAGFGSFGLILILLATWTTNDTNIYISSLAIASILERLKKWKIAVLCGLAGISVALFGIVDYFTQLLSILGILFGPAGAVFQAGLFFKSKNTDFSEHFYSSSFDLKASLAFVSGAAVSIMTNEKAQLGFELFNLTTIPLMDGYLVSLLVYVLVHKINHKTNI